MDLYNNNLILLYNLLWAWLKNKYKKRMLEACIKCFNILEAIIDYDTYNYNFIFLFFENLYI